MIQDDFGNLVEPTNARTLYERLEAGAQYRQLHAAHGAIFLMKTIYTLCAAILLALILVSTKGVA